MNASPAQYVLPVANIRHLNDDGSLWYEEVLEVRGSQFRGYLWGLATRSDTAIEITEIPSNVLDFVLGDAHVKD